MSFRILLWLIGALLYVASRLNPRLRAQITRDMTVSIASRDGIARSFAFRDRRVSSRPGVAKDAELVLMLPSAATGPGILLAPNAVQKIVAGLSTGTMELEGLPAHLLWFYEMVTAYMPWRRTPRQSLPGAHIAPNPDSRVASRITREPAQTHLDPNWANARTQREKLDMWQVAKGAVAPGAMPGYRQIVQAPLAETGEDA